MQIPGKEILIWTVRRQKTDPETLANQKIYQNNPSKKKKQINTAMNKEIKTKCISFSNSLMGGHLLNGENHRQPANMKSRLRPNRRLWVARAPHLGA
jgi:hypothetical protein